MADENLLSLQPGTVIGGRYEVVKCLGAGSMGMVYACRHRELSGHLVAVKVLFPEVAEDKVAAARFRNEVFASYGVSHPNVVRAYEYLRDGDLVAFTMEYVGGGDLAQRLGRADDPLPISEIIRILSQMCSGVQAIHDAGIVHRDLKPENILLTKDGNVKIADFGIARTGHGPKLTEHGGVVGTIDYVSPEYMLNSQVDWRSDIYAIGILGYEMVTGESPFRGDSVYATMTKRLKTDPQPPSFHRHECPPELDAIILRAMNRDPEKRFQSAANMFYALLELTNASDHPQAKGNTGAAGTLMQLGRNQSGAYVGPVLNRGNDAPESSPTGPSGASSVSSGNSRPSAASQSYARDYRPQDPTTPHVTASASTSRGNFTQSGGMADAGPARSGYGATSIVDSPVESQSGSHETPKMERMLTGGGRVAAPQAWPKPVSPGIFISSSSIDNERLRRLSQHADKVQSSLWGDVVIFLAAIVIGFGVGFGLIKMFAPDLLSKEGIKSKLHQVVGD